MSKPEPTIGPRFWDFTEPLAWVEYVKGMRVVAPNRGSKSVPDIIMLTNKKLVVKFRRPQREVTEAELALLAAEYAIEEPKLRVLFTARKIRIMNAEGVQTNVRERKNASKRGKAPKANAGSEPASGRPDIGSDQLLEPRADSDVPAQSPVLAVDGSAA